MTDRFTKSLGFTEKFLQTMTNPSETDVLLLQAQPRAYTVVS